MPTPSTHLGLRVPGTSTSFVTADIAFNWGRLDAYPGIFICTLQTLPSTWGSNQTGVLALTTDTGTGTTTQAHGDLWQWNGTAFRRLNSRGVLASITKSSSYTNSTTGATTIINTGTVTVYHGTRKMVASVFLPFVGCPTSTAKLALSIGGTNLTTVTLPSGWKGPVTIQSAAFTKTASTYTLKVTGASGTGSDVLTVTCSATAVGSLTLVEP
jgi:hypothetical protein